MLIKEYRKEKGLTQEALALQVGINYRSLQDYEQGHKKLSSANGDILLRLSTALGCSIEELLLEEVTDISTAPNRAENSISPQMIHNQTIHCAKHKTHGKWICTSRGVLLLFYYNGIKHTLPFDAVFTEKTLPWLKESASLMMESKIEETEFMQHELSLKGGLWDG